MNAISYHDFPKAPIGGRNPYQCCTQCGHSEPAINGRLEGHSSMCVYRLAKEAELRQKAVSEGKPSLATLYIDTDFSMELVDHEGQKICVMHEYLFENVHKGQIVQEVLKYLDGISVLTKIDSAPEWEGLRDQFKQRLLCRYIEHTTTKPLGDFLFIEQATKDIEIQLAFTH